MSPNCKKIWMFIIHVVIKVVIPLIDWLMQGPFQKLQTQRLNYNHFTALSCFFGKSSNYYPLLSVRMKCWEVSIYLWCRYGRARWADAHRGWSVWTAAGCAHEVWRCLRSPRTGWRDCAPPPWTGLSPNLSPHLGKKDRERRAEKRKLKLVFLSFTWVRLIFIKMEKRCRIETVSQWECVFVLMLMFL